MSDDNKSLFRLYKAADGSWWFIGVYSNNFEDREKEILSEAAHEDYITWANDKGVKPPIIVFHQPHYPDALHLVHLSQLMGGVITAEQYNEDLMQLYKATAVAQTERLMYSNGFAIVVAKVLPNKLSALKLLAGMESDWGMSHGFTLLRNDDNIINRYRSFEFSVLPEEYAANRLTAIHITGVNTMGEKLNDQDRQFLDALDIDDTELEAGMGKMKEILQRLISSKSVDVATEEDMPAVEESAEDVETKEETPTDEVAESATDEKVFDAHFKGIHEALVQAKGLIDNLTQRVEEQQKQIEALQKSDDEKIAGMYAPSWGAIFSNPSGVDNKELAEELKNDIPEGVVAEKDQDNPLNLAVWNMFSN